VSPEKAELFLPRCGHSWDDATRPPVINFNFSTGGSASMQLDHAVFTRDAMLVRVFATVTRLSVRLPHAGIIKTKKA